MTVFAHFRGMKTANRRMCARGADVSGFVRAVRTNVRDAILCGQPPSGAREARERCAASGRQPIFLHPFHGATELRSNTPLPGWGFRALRSAGTGRSRGGRKKGMDTYGFHPSFESPRFPLFLSRRTERLCRSYLCSGPKKENGSTATTS